MDTWTPSDPLPPHLTEQIPLLAHTAPILSGVYRHKSLWFLHRGDKLESFRSFRGLFTARFKDLLPPPVIKADRKAIEVPVGAYAFNLGRAKTAKQATLLARALMPLLEVELAARYPTLPDDLKPLTRHRKPAPRPEYLHGVPIPRKFLPLPFAFIKWAEKLTTLTAPHHLPSSLPDGEAGGADTA